MHPELDSERQKLATVASEMVRAINQNAVHSMFTTTIVAHNRLSTWKSFLRNSRVILAYPPITPVRITKDSVQFHWIRLLIRHLGQLTGALIEPPEQTALIDETMKVPGVLFAGVPGGHSHL